DSLAYPTFAALAAACRGSSCPLAFLTFGNYSATGNLVAMSRVPYMQSLQKIANADAVEGNPKAPYHDKFALDRIEQALREGHEAALSQPRLPRAERGENMLYAAQVNSKALQRVTEYIPATRAKERLSQPEQLHESLRELAGIVDHPLSKKFPLGLADKEKLQAFWG